MEGVLACLFYEPKGSIGKKRIRKLNRTKCLCLQSKGALKRTDIKIPFFLMILCHLYNQCHKPIFFCTSIYN